MGCISVQILFVKSAMSCLFKILLVGCKSILCGEICPELKAKAVCLSFNIFDPLLNKISAWCSLCSRGDHTILG